MLRVPNLRELGIGKTQLATAIEAEAIQQHSKRVRFFTTVELVNAGSELSEYQQGCIANIDHHGPESHCVRPLLD